MNRTDAMVNEAALVLARHQQSITAPTADEVEHGRPLPDPKPWMDLAGRVVEAALREHLDREGDLHRPDVAEVAQLQARIVELQGEVERLSARPTFRTVVPAQGR